MHRAIAATALALSLITLALAAAPALARPPTVISSPGYDRRLQESRQAQVAPAPPLRAPAPHTKSHQRHSDAAH